MNGFSLFSNFHFAIMSQTSETYSLKAEIPKQIMYTFNFTKKGHLKVYFFPTLLPNIDSYISKYYPY